MLDIERDFPNIKVLSVKGPWAWAIIAGIKGIENRPQRYHYRGPLAIHMSMSKDNDKIAMEVIRRNGFEPPSIDAINAMRGHIIGVVDLVDCLDLDQVASDPWAVGPYCLKVENGRKCIPIFRKGRLGLWVLE